MRLAQLLGVLLLREQGGLLLEPYFVDFRSRGIQFLACGEARLVSASHIVRHQLLPIACPRQRLLGRRTHRKLSLQRGFHRLAVDLSTFARELIEHILLLRCLSLQRFASACEFRQSLATGALGKACFLC